MLSIHTGFTLALQLLIFKVRIPDSLKLIYVRGVCLIHLILACFKKKDYLGLFYPYCSHHLGIPQQSSIIFSRANLSVFNPAFTRRAGLWQLLGRGGGKDIFVSDFKVVVGGWASSNDLAQVAAIWVDGQLTYLEDEQEFSSVVNSIFVQQ